VIPYSPQLILRKMIDEIRLSLVSARDENNPRVPELPSPVLTIPEDDEYWTVLPSFWFWFPTGFQRIMGRETVRQIRDTFRYFPHVAITGRSRWVDFALGGAMAQIISYRLYVVVAAPPAVDVVERLTNTITFFSFVILNRFSNPPFWWFTTVTEIEPVFRSNLFPQWTWGMVGGEIRCNPQVLPVMNVETG